MKESKAELTDRLRREGRFEAFKKRREELKAQGVLASDAWVQAATEFQYAVPSWSSPPRPFATRRQLRSLKRKPAIGDMKASQGVLENLDCDWVRPRDAPSIEACSLLTWARQSMATRTDFYRIYGSKLPAFSRAKKNDDPLAGLDRYPGVHELLGWNQGRSDGVTS